MWKTLVNRADWLAYADKGWQWVLYRPSHEVGWISPAPRSISGKKAPRSLVLASLLVTRGIQLDSEADDDDAVYPMMRSNDEGERRLRSNFATSAISHTVSRHILISGMPAELLRADRFANIN